VNQDVIQPLVRSLLCLLLLLLGVFLWAGVQSPTFFAQSRTFFELNTVAQIRTFFIVQSRTFFVQTRTFFHDNILSNLAPFLSKLAPFFMIMFCPILNSFFFSFQLSICYLLNLDLSSFRNSRKNVDNEK
jgi:hypothetical protein